jgi:hypothetical protein
MNRPLLARIAATLVLITCLGHTIGTFMEVPPEQAAMHKAIAVMKSTMVPMPVGSPRSYMQILDGNNLCTSLLLLLCGTQLLAVAGLPSSAATNRLIFTIAVALAGIAAISALYFFPVPAAFTALASMLSFIASTRRHPPQ